jgi:iron complex transport system substrate-binding protein
VLWLTPQSLQDIEQNIRDLGNATGRTVQAERLIEDGRERLEKLRIATAELDYRPRVFCMEWIDPVFASGHWVPEMVKIAGGIDELGREGMDSVRIPWEQVLEWQPEVLIVMPCGFNLPQVTELVPRLFDYPGWSSLPAVEQNRVYAVDANSYFARPGPRVIKGTELLAHLIHPDHFSWTGSAPAYRGFQFSLRESVDYYWEGPAMVFTAGFLLRRGYCCESGCRHCPYKKTQSS